MDRLDIGILRQLLQAQSVWPARPGLIASYRQIARALHVSPGTVRNRMKEMIRAGFLREFLVYPNPQVLGLNSGSYAVEIPPSGSKAEVMRRLADIEGVVFFENLRGNLLGLGIVYESPRGLTALLARIDSIVGSPSGIFTRVQHPPIEGRLTASEWELLGRLMAGRLLTYRHLAQELGVSVRTLKRRIARLVSSRAVLSFPRMELRAIEGGVTAELLVSFTDPSLKSAAEAKILARIDDWMIYAGIWEEFDIYRLILPNIAIVGDLAGHVGRIEGVRFARAEFVETLEPMFEKLLPLVKLQVASNRAGVREIDSR